MSYEVEALKRELKERQNECDTLRKKNQKFERDRQQWEQQKKMLESKQPVDVQLLMSQKRELTSQLNREQHEKEDLFVQMNSLIAQLAEKTDGDVVREENKILKRKLEDQEALSTAETIRLSGELQKAREKLDIETQTLRLEKKKLQADVDETRKELSMKSAALQSLMLAKQDTSKEEESKRLTAELASVREDFRNIENQNDALSREIQEKTKYEGELQSLNESLESQLKAMEHKIQKEEEHIKRLEENKAQLEMKLAQTSQEYEKVQVRLEKTENDVKAAEHGKDNLLKRQSDELTTLREANIQLKEERDELSERVTILEATLQEKDSKIDSTKVALLAAESRASQAEEDKRISENQFKNSERKVTQLQAQLDAAGNEEQEIEVLREELKKSEERYNLAQNRLQKSESASQLVSDNHRHEIEVFQTKVHDLEKEKEQLATSQAKITHLQEEIHKLTAEKHAATDAVRKLESDLEDSKNTKLSVANEITTLVDSISLLRSENGQYQEEIQSLEQELGELREEIEELTEERNEWRECAETAQKEKEALENEMEREKEKIVLLNSSSSSMKNETEQLVLKNVELTTQLSNLQQEHDELNKNHQKQMKAEVEQLAQKNSAEYEKLQSTLDRLNEEKKESVAQWESQLKIAQQELEHSKERVRELEEERSRVIGSSDVEKKRLLDEAHEQRDKAEAANSELVQLTEKLTLISSSLASEKSKSHELEDKLTKLAKELEEAKATANTSSEAKTLISEIEAQNVQLKKQLEALEEDSKTKLSESVVKGELLEKQISDMKAARVASDNQRREMEERIEAVEKLEKKVADLDAKLLASSKAQQEHLLNLKNMTELLESESKRVEEAAQEKRRLKDKLEEVERNFAEAQQNPQENDGALIAENARLASELLKARSHTEQAIENEREQMEKQFEIRMTSLNNQLAASTSRIEELNRTIVQTEKKRKDEVAAVYNEMDMVKNERARLQTKIDEMYNNSSSMNPNRRISNMSAITNFSTADFSEIEDVEILRREIDKQRRLIIVLRRKLQGLHL